MASMRRLHRNLVRWRRYGRRIDLQGGIGRVEFPRGYRRAIERQDREWVRRRACPICGDPMCYVDCWELVNGPRRAEP